MRNSICWLLFLLQLSFACGSKIDQWEDFKRRFCKKYNDPREDWKRRQLWEARLYIIEGHNKEADRGLYTYRLGENEKMDLTVDEWKTFLGTAVGFRTSRPAVGVGIKLRSGSDFQNDEADALGSPKLRIGIRSSSDILNEEADAPGSPKRRTNFTQGTSQAEIRRGYGNPEEEEEGQARDQYTVTEIHGECSMNNQTKTGNREIFTENDAPGSSKLRTNFTQEKTLQAEVLKKDGNSEGGQARGHYTLIEIPGERSTSNQTKAGKRDTIENININTNILNLFEPSDSEYPLNNYENPLYPPWNENSRPGDDLPLRVDYSKDQCTGPIKDQGICGSCWAFSSIFPTEFYNCRHKGKLTILSEQELVDCEMGQSQGCEGGWPSEALDYIIRRGSCTAESYPYTSGCTGNETMCHRYCRKAGALRSWAWVKRDPFSIRAALAKIGPLMMTFHATEKFVLYKSGIFNGPCTSDSNHAVCFVGYDFTGPIPYWIVRNSFGGTWGMGGYGYIEAGRNLCACESEVQYPIY